MPIAPDTPAEDAKAACRQTAVVTAGFGEAGQALNTVAADVPAGRYRILVTADIWYDSNTNGTVDNGEVRELGYFASDYDPDLDDDDDTRQPIIVLDGQTTTGYIDVDAESYGIFNVFIRDDETDLGIPGASVCLYEAEDMFLRGCLGTNEEGMTVFTLNANTYVFAVTAPDYEQESVTVTYSPLADILDGGNADPDFDESDLVVALDPAQTPLNVLVTVDDAPTAGVAVSVHVVNGLDSGTECFGAQVDAGITEGDGIFTASVLPGTYCVESTVLDSDQGSIATSATASDADAADTVHTTHAYTANTGVLDIGVTLNGSGIDAGAAGATYAIHVQTADDTTLGSCIGALVESGTIGPDGLAEHRLQSGDYCVQTTITGTNETARMTVLTLMDGNPNTNTDVVHEYTAPL